MVLCTTVTHVNYCLISGVFIMLCCQLLYTVSASATKVLRKYMISIVQGKRNDMLVAVSTKRILVSPWRMHFMYCSIPKGTSWGETMLKRISSLKHKLLLCYACLKASISKSLKFHLVFFLSEKVITKVLSPLYKVLIRWKVRQQVINASKCYYRIFKIIVLAEFWLPARVYCLTA